MVRTLHVEGDEIGYRCAFAVEKQRYGLYKNDSFIKLFKKDILNKDMKEYAEKLTTRALHHTYSVQPHSIDVEPLENCLHIVKSQLFKLKEIGELKIWLSPENKSNFRFGVAKTPGPNGLGYKAGRKRKPTYLKEVRDYMKEWWGAKEIDGYEADDALGMGNGVKVHIDKDINMVEGLHLNWLTGERYIVEPGLNGLKLNEGKLKGYGTAFFFAQLLMGDSTDNIPGIKGIGPVKAFNLLKNCKTEAQCLDIVRKEYILQYKDEWHHTLMEIASLVYIVREPDIYGSNYIGNLLNT